MHVIAAKAVCFKEALGEDFKAYQKRVVHNASVLAENLRKKGFRIVSGGTDNHLMLLDLRNTGVTGKDMQERGDAVRITLNKNTIPNEPLSPFVTSGIRIGTPAVTTRGMGEKEMEHIAGLLWWMASDFEARREDIKEEVKRLCRESPLYK